MFGSMGVMELAVIGVIVALIFGPRQLPKLGKALGETIKELKNAGKELRTGVSEVEREVETAKRIIKDEVEL